LLIPEASYWQHSLAKNDRALGPDLTRQIVAVATLVGAQALEVRRQLAQASPAAFTAGLPS
jgi:hypothetical protein